MRPTLRTRTPLQASPFDITLAFDGVLVRLFTGDPAVRAQVSAMVMVALLPLLVPASVADGWQAARG
ncbi:hypothetical protein ACWENQ_36885 [Nonomuraea sp. NPDC004354]